VTSSHPDFNSFDAKPGNLPQQDIALEKQTDNEQVLSYQQPAECYFTEVQINPPHPMSAPSIAHPENSHIPFVSPLPILAVEQEFCRRLLSEKVVVLTAPTGSGKTTQLPQICARFSKGLVVCTQPRQLAAVSIAHRIAVSFAP